MELSEMQRRARRKMIICAAVCLTIYLPLLLIIIPMLPMGQAERMFLIIVSPIPFVTVLSCFHRWIHHHSYNAISTAALIVVLGISFTCIFLTGVRGYNIVVDTDRKTQEIRDQLRLPSAVPPPTDLSPPSPPIVASDVSQVE
jgi:cytochrome bd-type quinol oxidase subunit 2